MHAIQRNLSFTIVLGVFLASLSQATTYTWTGGASNGNWTNAANWSGGSTYPSNASDNAQFTQSVLSTNVPTLNVSVTNNLLTLSAQTNCSILGTGTLTLSNGVSLLSAYTNTIGCKLAGSFGIAVTSGVLVLTNANLYTGVATVTGGVLDVSSTLFTYNVASAAGSNATPVLVGGGGSNAELRVGVGGNRGITVQSGGAGTNTIRFAGANGATLNFTNGMYTLNANAVLAPGYLTDSFNPASIYNIGTLAGPGSITVAGGVNTIAFGSSTNTFTGSVSVVSGILSVPSFLTQSGTLSNEFGNQQIFLGDVSGTNSATLQFGTSGASAGNNFFTPALTVNAGSIGAAVLDLSLEKNLSSYLIGPFTLNKSLNVLCGYGALVAFSNNTFSGAGGLNITQTVFTLASSVPSVQNLVYNGINSPGFAGNTTLSGMLGTAPYLYGTVPLKWNYPGTTGDNLLLRFGSSNGVPSSITLNGGQFEIYSTTNVSETYTIDNPVFVSPNNYVGCGYPGYSQTYPNCNALQWGFAGTNGVISFTGPIALGNTLELGDLTSGSAASVGHYSGTVTIDQSAGGRRSLWVSQKSFTTLSLDGNLVDGTSGTAANSLILQASAGSAAPINLTGTGSTFAGGTVVDGDTGAASIFNVTSASGSLGLGNIWLSEGGRLRLNQAGQLANGASMTLYGNQSALSVLALGGTFPLPALTTDSYGVLAIDANNYTAITDQSQVGNGLMVLGSITGGTLTAPTLNPCRDGIYRLGGAGGTLTVANGALTSATSPLQVGAPCAAASTVGATYANGSGTVLLQAANTYSGTVVNANCTLLGQAQTSGSPFGNTTAGMTLNGGLVQLNAGSVPVTNTVGPLNVNGSGTLCVNIGTTTLTQTVLRVASLPLASATAPWSLILVGRTGNGNSDIYLGGKLRIVVTGTPPAVTNGMVAPNLLLMDAVSGSDIPDFLTYNGGTDTSGSVIGFTNANAYTTVSSGSLDGMQDGTKIVNLTTSVTNTQADSIYALRMNSYSLTNIGAASLTIGSGGILATAGTIYENISFGNAMGLVFVTSGGTLNFNSAIAGTNGVVKTGPGKINLNTANTFTGTVACVQGTVVASLDQAFGAATNPLYVDAGALMSFSYTATNNHPIAIGPGGGTFKGAGTLMLGGPLTGIGTLAFSGGNTTWKPSVTNANNTYSGGTLIIGSTSSGGNNMQFSVASNSTLGVGDVAIQNAFWNVNEANSVTFNGDRNIGGGDIYSSNPTTNRQARLSIQPGCQAWFMSTNPSVGSLSGSGNLFLTNTTLSVGGDNSSTIFDGYLYQNGVSTGQLYKTGSGIFVFKGVSFLNGTNVVNNGTLEVDGAMSGAVSVNSNATLQGAGSVGAVTLNSGSTFLPGVTTNSPVITSNRMCSLSAGSLTMASNATVVITINSATNYTQISAGSGPISLGGANLQVNVNPGYAPTATDTFTIITNASSVAGQFAGLPSPKSTILLGNGYHATINYRAGSVTLSAMTKGAAGTGIFFW